ncbi:MULTISPECIES: amidophosphoribosyltransferase [Intestinimonas]|uniref:Amidophosphoribosyltransferase n=1 Tax=Intestinimonas massiliensis (ex Afouda et al. 2020) TaxID=1673721 RepID=A0AAW5JQX4_9FIRM|nr:MULTISPECIES: amidophosphoribosyltransferase [Intestinimonas]MBS6282707.1 amidophosphoribosyltransferase [Oscillospiraceae bacterium]MCQ4770881.1 amidophosphoribosyltransferase [Intestinimonas massiliensis (ex Afouda et al. 2020)]MDU1323573.1 amidophosphoribosyltransferase [Clostridiales bacterium]
MSIHEECGVFGIYDPAGDCARTTYYGLYSLQHRGQEACGIATINDRELSYHKDLGLVGDVFHQDVLDRLGGTMAVGHVRYSTTGGVRRENAQPLTLKYVKGTLAVAHNGNLVNTPELRTSFEYRGAIFQTTTDSELIAYAIAQERLRCGSAEEAVCQAVKGLRGAFSLIVMSARKLIAARDPWGFRPLCMGRRGQAVVFASESCALDAVGAAFEREIDPGEIVVVEDGQVRSIRENCAGATSHMCIFEYIYFARPDSVICGQSVHEARLEAGRILAREHPVDADVVIGVPDSGLDAAMGYAEESGIPYGQGFVKNRYIGRTFITPDQQSREQAVRIKLGALRSTVEGRRVVMIDDSIVRGTTSRQIISLLREAGAKEVHFRVSAPPFIAPCYFGTDIPDKKDLIACHHTVEEIRRLVGADTLGFLSVDALERIAPSAACGFCKGCFTEEYPVATAGM